VTIDVLPESSPAANPCFGVMAARLVSERRLVGERNGAAVALSQASRNTAIRPCSKTNPTRACQGFQSRGVVHLIGPSGSSPTASPPRRMRDHRKHSDVRSGNAITNAWQVLTPRSTSEEQGPHNGQA
jgi:hypothetical protein